MTDSDRSTVRLFAMCNSFLSLDIVMERNKIHRIL